MWFLHKNSIWTYFPLIQTETGKKDFKHIPYMFSFIQIHVSACVCDLTNPNKELNAFLLENHDYNMYSSGIAHICNSKILFFTIFFLTTGFKT